MYPSGPSSPFTLTRVRSYGAMSEYRFFPLLARILAASWEKGCADGPVGWASSRLVRSRALSSWWITVGLSS